MKTDKTTILKLLKLALLEFDDNPTFVSFRLLSSQSARAANKKLKENGYNSKVVCSDYIKIEKSPIQ